MVKERGLNVGIIVISLLSVVGRICAWILVRVRRVIDGLADDEQGGFRVGRKCADQIGEKALEKKLRLYVGFMDLKKACGRVNREALWQIPRMYDVGCKLLNGIKSMHVNGLACVSERG